MFFTQEDYRKIEQWLQRNSVKDTEFQEALPLNGLETITLVQDEHNKKVFIKDLVDQIFKLGVSDFLNVTDKYEASHITLGEAIKLIPSGARKVGQVITFLNTDGNWQVYQFKGVLNQWNQLDLWEDLFDWGKFAIDSILPDEEDLTKSLPDEKGNSYLSLKDRKYEPDNYSGLGRVILRKNIMEIEDPIYGKVRKNVLYQDMINKENTIYEIRYDFDLNGAEITIPKGCVLKFEGGILSNGTLIGQSTTIETPICKIFELNLNLFGIWSNTGFYPEYYGAIGDGITDDTASFQKLDKQVIRLCRKTYALTNLVFHANTSLEGCHKTECCLLQLLSSDGDFIRMEDWSHGNITNLRIQGNKHCKVRDDIWMQALLKIVVHTYNHDVQENQETWNNIGKSSYFSNIENILIQNSCYNGLSVNGAFHRDPFNPSKPEDTSYGKKCAYSWIHHFHNLWIENCNGYGIYDAASDNLWEYINISHCGLANLYLVGSAEVFINMKLDGESGFACDHTLTPYQILKREYEGAAIIMLGSGCYLEGLDIQSMLYCGIKIEGSNNIIRGTMNNIGLEAKTPSLQQDTPGIYFYRASNRQTCSNIIDFIVFHYSEEYTQMPIRYNNSERAGLFIKNQINIRYTPYNNNYSNDYYKKYLNVLKGIERLGNQIISPTEITNFKQGVYVAYKTTDNYVHYAENLTEYLNVKATNPENVAPLGIYLCEGGFSFIIGLEDLFGPLGSNTKEIELYGPKFVLEKSGLEATYASSKIEELPSDSITKQIAQYNPFPNMLYFWYIPSLFEQKVIYKHITEINYLLNQIGGNPLDITTYYGTISKSNELYINALNMVNGFVYTYVNWQSLKFRPICRNNKTVPLFKFSNTNLINYMNTNNRTPKGFCTFNETLGKPVWWTGSKWVDATGATV